MHIPDGFVNGTINLAGFGASAICCSYSIRKINRTMDERHIPLLGVTSAFIFAAQMINFPIAGGTSGHFLGALMAAILMGPWASCLIMSLVSQSSVSVSQMEGLQPLGRTFLIWVS